MSLLSSAIDDIKLVCTAALNTIFEICAKYLIISWCYATITILELTSSHLKVETIESFKSQADLFICLRICLERWKLAHFYTARFSIGKIQRRNVSGKDFSHPYREGHCAG